MVKVPIVVLALMFQLIPWSGCGKRSRSTIPVPRGEAWWRARVGQLTSLAKKGPYDLVFFGDSITAGWAKSGRAVWLRHFGGKGLRALNLGISGDRTEHLLWRLDHGNLAGLKGARQPKVAVLLIGTNNLWRDKYPAIARGVVAVVKRLRHHLPKTTVLVMAILPRGAIPNGLRKRAWRASRLAKDMLLREPRVHFIDIGRRFLDAKGRLTRTVAPDLLHLSPRGYAIWAQALAPILRRHVGR